MSDSIFRLHAAKLDQVAGLLDLHPKEWSGSHYGTPTAIVVVDDCGPNLRAALIELGATEIEEP